MKIKTSLIGLLTIGLLIFLSGCKKGEVNAADPQGLLLNYNGCKNLPVHLSSPGKAARVNVQECIEYRYDGKKTLEMDHINALFNCCPGEIRADFEFNGNTITITEIQAEEGCHCICHFDVNFHFDNIQPGTCTFRIIAGDNHGEDREFTVNLISNPSGSKCWESPYGF